jgi:hypothetical protein
MGGRGQPRLLCCCAISPPSMRGGGTSGRAGPRAEGWRAARPGENDSPAHLWSTGISWAITRSPWGRPGGGPFFPRGRRGQNPVPDQARERRWMAPTEEDLRGRGAGHMGGGGTCVLARAPLPPPEAGPSPRHPDPCGPAARQTQHPFLSGAPPPPFCSRPSRGGGRRGGGGTLGGPRRAATGVVTATHGGESRGPDTAKTQEQKPLVRNSTREMRSATNGNNRPVLEHGPRSLT